MLEIKRRNLSGKKIEAVKVGRSGGGDWEENLLDRKMAELVSNLTSNCTLKLRSSQYSLDSTYLNPDYTVTLQGKLWQSILFSRYRSLSLLSS